MNCQVGGSLGPVLWTMTGDHGDKWMSGQVKLPASVVRSQFQLVFEGVVGKSWTGDIAIDDITVQSGAGCLSAGDNGGMIVA